MPNHLNSHLSVAHEFSLQWRSRVLFFSPRHFLFPRSMSRRHSSSLMLVRPFRLRLSILDLHPSQPANTNESSTESSTSARRSNPLTFKFTEHETNSTVKTDAHDREIIQRFLQSTNEVEAREVLAQMWKESRFCDLMLVVDGSEYLAHRIVLGEIRATWRASDGLLRFFSAAFSPKYR